MKIREAAGVLERIGVAGYNKPKRTPNHPTKSHVVVAKEGDISDLDWVNGMKSFFDHLKSEGRMEDYRITRCKMGFRSIADMPEWMILMEFKDMAQMDSAFKRVAPLEGELEAKHKSFNQFVSGTIQHALFRDWPDQNL